jgi:hypothetical protein
VGVAATPKPRSLDIVVRIDPAPRGEVSDDSVLGIAPDPVEEGRMRYALLSPSSAWPAWARPDWHRHTTSNSRMKR